MSENGAMVWPRRIREIDGLGVRVKLALQWGTWSIPIIFEIPVKLVS